MAVAYQEKFKEAGLTALLGSGFDPGRNQCLSAYALKHYFDEIHYIDILDCNGGDHGYPFATNFNPEIIYARFLRQVLTGKMENGSKLKPCLSSASTIPSSWTKRYVSPSP